MNTLLKFIGAIYDSRHEIKESAKDLDVKLENGLIKLGNLLERAANKLQGR